MLHTYRNIVFKIESMGARVRNVVEWTERKEVKPFELQKAFLTKDEGLERLYVILGEYIQEKVEICLLPEPIIKDNIVYILTVKEISKDSPYYLDYKRKPIFTEKGVSDREHSELYLLYVKLESFEYQTT